MRIIDIAIRQTKTKIRLLAIGQTWLVVVLICLLAVTGCTVKSEDVAKARDYSAKAAGYYQQAVKSYRQLIAKDYSNHSLVLELARLYYQHGDLDSAEKELKSINIDPAKKLLAIVYFRKGNYNDALELFSRNESGTDEYLYYYGLTCEKLNLFDKALVVYSKIKLPTFKNQALARINLIEKNANTSFLKDLGKQINSIVSSSPDQKRFPQAGALILYCDEKVEITPDNTSVTYLHYIVKILNERGKEEFAETAIDYDSTYEKVELEYARVIKPDATVVQVGTRHIRDVSQYLNFPLYSNARIFIISFPEISEGAIIEYKAKIYSNQLINKKDYCLAYPIQTSEPVIQANFTLTCPQDRNFNIKILNREYSDFGSEVDPKITKESGFVTYVWSFKNVPQIIPESNMPPYSEINPTIFISTFNSWQEVYQWWWSLAKDKIMADNPIKQKVKELTSGAHSDETKIKAIYNYCAQKVRYVAVEYGQAGYEPHSAALIFSNKYGDCKDKAILLVTMLKEAGFVAYPVLIPTREDYNLNTDFPSMYFNHAIAAVLFSDKIYFVDPTAETCPFGDLPSSDQARGVFIVKEKGFELQTTPLFEPEHNLVKQQTYMKIDINETMGVKKQVLTFGAFDQTQRYWLLYTTPELVEESLKEKIQSVSVGAELESYDIKNLGDLNIPIILSYVFSGSEYLIGAGPLRIIPQLSGLDNSLVARQSRRYPLDFINLESKETIWEIEIPHNFKVKYIPQDIVEQSPWFDFQAEYKLSGNKINFRQLSRIKKLMIYPAEYPEFKNFYESLAKRVKQRVVLEKGK